MNKKIYSLMLTVLALMGLVSSCSDKDDIVFDHERQQFETRADRILLEFIAPFGTTADEEIYIVGAFNGDSAAIGNEMWLAQKAPKSDVKWGIYLDPNTFEAGKNLANGFRFYSVTQGMEYTIGGELAQHMDNPGVGTFTNIWGQRWESYYRSGSDEEEEEVDHDGFVVYVDDQTGWDDLTLYMWGDVNDLNGGWPGMSVTGTVKKGGITWKYFDMGAANTGLAENLIFNNGGNGVQLADFAFTIDRNIYLRVTAEGVEEVELEPTVKHDGFALFILNESSQTDLALYAWGDAEAFGGWPGMPATGTQTINGLTYTYFDLGESNTGLNLNLIPNNNGGGVQWEGGDLNFTIDHDIYLRIFDGGYEVISKDYQGGGNTPGPDPQPVGETVIIAVKNSVGFAKATTANGWCLFELPAGGTFNLILNDNGSPQIDGPEVKTVGSHFFDVANGWEESPNTVTIQNNAGYSDPHLYAWGDGEIYGGWRGIKPTSNQGGTLVFPLPNDGGTYNLILNGEGDGVQQDIATVVANQSFTFTAN